MKTLVIFFALLVAIAAMPTEGKFPQFFFSTLKSLHYNK